MSQAIRISTSRLRSGFLCALWVAFFGMSGLRDGIRLVFAKEPVRPNVLFIAVDDLRPELGCYGEQHMRTPHLDRFAETARVFHRHYVQVPTCGASRYALLTGRRPDVGENWNNNAFQKLSLKPTLHPQTFPECFRCAGYRTISIGKISHQPDGHVYEYDGSGTGEVEVPFAWDEVGLPYGKWKYGWGAFFAYASGLHRGNAPEVAPIESADVDDRGYPDGLIAEEAVSQLQQLSKQQQPFLLAVGFFKPHLPFTAPEKYWDFYERDAIPLSPNPGKPEGIHPASWHHSAECFGARYRSGDWPRDEENARQLRHGYFAAVSYVDAQIGLVLDTLEKTGLGENTIVIIWGDHGWHLGDHAIWGKHTLFERSARSTLMIRTPQLSSPGHSTNAIVETVDLFPTLTSLCGLDAPRHCAGLDLSPILENPEHPGKAAALTYWKGGTAIRTERYRMVVYPTGNPRVELYDHATDPHETRSIAEDQPKVVKELMSLLQENSPQLQKQ